MTWTVNVQCGGTGGLAVSPQTAFELSGPVGGPFSPTSRSYGLNNTGASTLNYIASLSYADATAPGWLGLSATTGTLAPSGTGSLTVSINSTTSGLVPGSHMATLTVKTTGANPQTATRSITLTVQPGATLPPKISGRITASDGMPLEGVRMDGLPSVNWTDSNGDYSVFAGIGWSGTVRPFKLGYDFAPLQKTYPPLTAGFTAQDYVGTPRTQSLSGRVTLDGAGLADMAMVGLPGSPITDATGAYIASLPFPWSGTVTPTATAYTFTPGTVTYSNVGMNLVDENYVAFRQSLSVTGRVTLGTAGLGGVLLNGLPGSVVTAADGSYSGTVPYGWSGTSNPQTNGYVFSPPSRDYEVLDLDQSAQDFAASQSPRGSNRLWIVSTSEELHAATILAISGDLVLVKPGTYIGANPSSLAPGALLLSEAGADQTVIEVTQFVVNTSNTVIDGFTFRGNGGITDPVHIAGSSNVTFRNCRFQAPTGGYGVRVTDAQNVLIERSVFSGYGGLIVYSGTSSGTLTLRNNSFVGNTSPVDSGTNPSLQVILENNLFRGALREAVRLGSISSVLSRNNIFDGNLIGMSLSSISGTVQLSQDTWVRNGTGFDVGGRTTALIYNAIFQGNTHALEGTSTSTISVHHTMHWLDTAWINGGANYILDEPTIRETDPRFVNFTSGDLHLAANSPARGSGQGGFDLGAYGGPLGTAWITPPGTPQASPTLLEIEITGPGVADPGDTIGLAAKGHFQNGYYAPYSGLAQWSSSDPATLQSLGSGSFRALRPGQVVVTARSGSVAGTFQVTVLAPLLELSVADTMDPVSPGGPVTYQLSVTNHGPGVAGNVQITALYDARTSFSSSTPPPATGFNNRWSLGTLQPGESAAVSVDLQVAGGTAGASLTLSANATADFATGVNASETTGVLGTFDLSAQASLTPAQVRPGERLTATLTFRNDGTATAQGVVLEAFYPADTLFVSATPPPSSGSGTWFVGQMAPGEQRVLTIALDARPSASGTLVLTAEARNSSPDPTPVNNQAVASATVISVANLGITATDSPDPVPAGQPLLYHITITNQGPSTANAVTLTAHVPTGLVVGSTLPEVGTCSGASPVACQLGSLASGASVSTDISGIPGTAGLLQMSATAFANEEDPTLGNNVITLTTNVLCSFNLSTESAGFEAQGGTGAVNVTAAAGCPWIAVSNASWINITQGNSGNGNGTATYTVASNGGGARNGTLSIAGQTFAVNQGGSGQQFFTVAPCRVLDTRPTSALVSGAIRLVQIGGLCGIPPTAKAVSLNVTAVGPTGSGFVTLWPADLVQPQTSVVNLSAGKTRTNNAILSLATDGGGGLNAAAFIGGSGTVHLILDVNGYFE